MSERRRGLLKGSDSLRAFLRQVRLFPLSWLHFSLGSRLLFVAFSYVLGVAGLWLLFPPTHDGSTMFLPIASACWLFRYRGLLVSLLLNGIAFQVAYLLLLRGLLPDSAYVEGGIIGFVASLGIGLIVCWLRTAVDSARAAEHERLLAEFREQQAKFAFEQQLQINALKDQFLLNVSHELRTPLTSLAGFLDLFATYYEHMDPVTRAQMLKEAQASQVELVALVERVLDATRVVGDIPEAKPEAVNIQHLLQEVLNALAPGDRAAYLIHVQVNEQVMTWADPLFLRQVLHNLLANIFKYVPRQTEICIEVTQTAPSSPVYLSVQDEGPGIPVDEQPLLFEKFVRLKRDLAGSTRGTGLGLYLCKQYIEAMGGRIWIESPAHEGRGSRFCLTLPPVPPS
jgi:signal transduction histidine kinase